MNIWLNEVLYLVEVWVLPTLTSFTSSDGSQPYLVPDPEPASMQIYKCTQRYKRLFASLQLTASCFVSACCEIKLLLKLNSYKLNDWFSLKYYPKFSKIYSLNESIEQKNNSFYFLFYAVPLQFAWWQLGGVDD